MEQNGIWAEDFKIRAFMVDKYREANLFTLLNLCQEAAGNHAHFRQLGYADMQARGMAWVLNRLKIKVFQYPKWMETVTVKTWVSQMQPFSHRHFQISTNDTSRWNIPLKSGENREGGILANAYSIWIPIDVVSKRPKRLTQEDFPLNNLEYDCEMPEKLGNTVTPSRDEAESIKGGIFSAEREVKASDLDMLGHVNNAKYVEWLLDDLSNKGIHTKPHSLEINYLGEVFEKSVVQFFTKKIDTEVFYTVKNRVGEKEVCRAKLEM
jgi:medium-chain acyl-[acyl-carrier-protein] hydrolase